MQPLKASTILAGTETVVEANAAILYDAHCQKIYTRVDRVFAILMLFQWLAGILVAWIMSPQTWDGDANAIHPHVWAAIFLGGAISIFPIFLGLFRAGYPITRYTIAVGQMLTSALLIHVSGGRIEMHFHIFGSLAFLSFYREWRILVVATTIIAIDHFIRGIYFPASVFGVLTTSHWRWLEHVCWVAFEDLFLIPGCLYSVGEMHNIARHRAELEVSNAMIERTYVELQHSKSVAEEANLAKAVVLDTALDAVVTIDAAGRISTWNLQAETMFRWDRNEVEGLRLDEVIFSEQQWDAHRREIEGFLRTGNSPLLDKVTELIARRRDGRDFPVELAITPAWCGDQCTFTAFIRDITVRKQAEADLRQARDAADSANRAKSEFLAKMSHEIRTPLNGVIGMSGLLLGTDLDQKQRRYAELIKSSGASLAELINDILDFSKIEAHKMEIESIDFDLYAAIEDASELMLIKAAEKGIDIACLTPPDVPQRVKGDPQRVKQILINLMNNAIKFTETGSVGVRLTVEDRTRDHVTVKFAVTDTGIGIPADRTDRLFKSFSQVDASTTRTHGGTGLGLAICKQLAEMMGGAIGVNSTMGQGSTFWFTVRFGHGSPAVMPLHQTPRDSRDLRVLVVHNDAAMREILHYQLCSWRLEAAVAATGAEAVKMLRDAAAKSLPFDVTIVDGELADTNAMEWGRAVKAQPEIAGTTLLVLLPVGEDMKTAKIKEVGFAGHLLKPVRQSRLYDSIVDALSSKSPPKLSVEAGRGKRRSPVNAAAEAPAKILIAEDNRANQIVASEVLIKHGYACDIADNGIKAVAAVATGAYDLVLMDCSMPEMDGFEATRRIRQAEEANASGRPQHIPIIALTANAISGDRQMCIEAGMDDYISKPLDPQLMVNAIQLLLAKSPVISRPAQAAPPAAMVSPTDRESKHAPLSIDALLARCMGDMETVAAVLDEFESQAVADLAALKKHVAAGDFAAMARVAHALKGASGMLSANALAGIALKLEAMGRSGVPADVQSLLIQLNDEVRRCIDYLPALRADIAANAKV
jgi:PAS domain S-box-containing protein